jgi:hypothetical protein
VTKQSERRVCRTLGQHRSTQRQVPRGRNDEEQFTVDLIELARQYGRYGAIRVARRQNSTDVIDVLLDLLLLRGVPGHVRSDKAPRFIAKAVQNWITAVGAKTA